MCTKQRKKMFNINFNGEVINIEKVYYLKKSDNYLQDIQ